MTNEEAIKELNRMKESFKNTIEIVNKKRWKLSEKVMTQAKFARYIEAVEIGIMAIKEN